MKKTHTQIKEFIRYQRFLFWIVHATHIKILISIVAYELLAYSERIEIQTRKLHPMPIFSK